MPENIDRRYNPETKATGEQTVNKTNRQGDKNTTDINKQHQGLEMDEAKINLGEQIIAEIAEGTHIPDNTAKQEIPRASTVEKSDTSGQSAGVPGENGNQNDADLPRTHVETGASTRSAIRH